MRLTPFILILPLLAFNASAATYYIDYNAADDSANGTSTSTPWKRHPYMTGWSGSYVHAAGDTFIFKGGVTWPTTVFPMTIAAGGSSTSVRDTYTSDAAWYSGGAWSRPSFDGEDTVTANATLFKLNGGVDFVNVLNLDFKRNRGLWVSQGGFFGMYAVVAPDDTTITISNCWIRDWSLSLPHPGGANQDEGNGGGLLCSSATAIIADNLFTQEGSAGDIRCGVALKGAGIIRGNTFRVLCDAIIGGYIVTNNSFTDIQDATDTDMHEDVIYCTSSSTVANNIVSNATAAAPVIYLEPNRASSTGTTLVYNNVAMNTGYAPISIDLGGANPGADLVIKIFNNTVEGNTNTCVRSVDRPTALGRLDITNNWFLSGGEPYDLYPGTVTTLNSGANLTNTVAQAALVGATEANAWRPTDATWPGIGAGVNLSAYFGTDKNGDPRPEVGAWDLGAYEYVDTTPRTFTIPGTARIGTLIVP